MRTGLLVLVVGCDAIGPGAAAPRVPSQSTPADAPPAPLATFVAVKSPAAYCAAVAAEKPAEPDSIDPDLDPPIGCSTEPAWTGLDAKGALPAGQPIAPFDALRVRGVMTAQREHGCALLVRVGAHWFASTDAIKDCFNNLAWIDERTAERSATTSRVGQRLAIETTGGEDTCVGCDADTWLAESSLTVCGLASGEPVCTQPIWLQDDPIDTGLRVWTIRGDVIEFGAPIHRRRWVGTVPAPGQQRAVPDADGGGSAERFTLPF
jgi:hypothetical protein